MIAIARIIPNIVYILLYFLYFFKNYNNYCISELVALIPKYLYNLVQLVPTIQVMNPSIYTAHLQS